MTINAIEKNAKNGPHVSAYTALQGGLVLLYPISPVVALQLLAAVPSLNPAGVTTCLDEDSLAPSFRRHPASKQLNTSNCSTASKHPSSTCVGDV